MKRRNSLKLSMAASVFAATARGAENTPAHERGSAGFRVGAQKDRREEKLLIMGGRFDLKVSSRNTGGDLCIYDTVRSEKGGPALHRHHFQDEWFYVLRGECIVQVGNDMEDFFLQMSKLGKEIPKDQETTLQRLWAEHGMEIVGPPLKF